MARKKIEKKSGKWEKTLLEDAPVRPPVNERVLVWGEDESSGMISFGTPPESNPIDRIADFLEWSKPLLEKAVAVLVPAAPEIPLPKNPTFSVRETAKALKLHPQTISKYCREHVFGKKMPNGKWRISKSEIEHWLKGQHMIHGRTSP